MDITNYTSHIEVRTTTGLSSDDLPDTLLESEIYANVLDLALSDVEVPEEAPGPGPLATRFLVIADIAEGSRTALEQKLYNLTRIYATYAVALEVIVSLSMRAPKTISDSKASLVRFSPEATFLVVIEEIKGRLASAKSAIENINSTSATVDQLLTVVSPVVDVVTGA